MAATSKLTRIAFYGRAAKTAATSYATFAALASLAADYADVYAAEVTVDDFTPTPPATATALTGYDLADLAALIAGVAQINAALDANDGALRKAVKRLSQFAR